MSRLVALYGGGDWADASCEHLVVPDDMNLKEEKEKWNKWYYGEYCVSLGKTNGEYISFEDWLIKKGAEKAEKEIEKFWE